MPADTPQPIRLKDYRPADYLIERVELDISLAPGKARVRARLAVRPNPKAEAAGAPLVLDGEKIALEHIALDGRALSHNEYQVGEASLTIPAVPAGPFTVDITTTCDPDANTELTGLYRSNGIWCTQCEAEGFRRITYFLDRPDVLAVYLTRIEAEKSQAPILLANGNLIDSGDIGGVDRHYAVWEDPFPKPSYLFAMVGGGLACVEDSFTTMSGRDVALKIYVEPGKEDRCGWAMASLQAAMRWDEEMFGREYDLDIFMIVAVSDFNMGAMENKGLNIFNDKYILARPDTATDQDYANIEAIIAHEYFHNWTGNRITCRDWFQLCLKEGLTVFRDQEFSADMRSRAVKRIHDVRLLRAHQFPEDAGPLAHPVRPDSYIEINNFYTATVYEKGAELVRMIQTILGVKRFRAGMDLYFQRHDGEAATVEDFLKAMEDAAGEDLAQFRLWYSQAGTPDLAVTGKYDSRRKLYELRVSQSVPPTPGQPAKKPMHIPLRFGLVGPGGEELGGNESNVLNIREQEETFRFTGIAARPVPSLNRGFSAPVTITSSPRERDLELLMASDGDLFNRWQAAQTFATRILLRMVEAIRAGQPPRRGERLAHALGETMRNDALEPAYRADFMKLPSEADLAREIGENVDPDAVHGAREHLRRSIGEIINADLRAIYEQMAVEGPYSPEADPSGRRALRNAALAYLAAPGTPKAAAFVSTHFHAASNMTDSQAALGLIAAMDLPERQILMAEFYAKWRGDPLVVDKWLAVQAASPLPGTPDHVRALMSHEAFALTSPNKVRSLIGVFAAANPVGFNRSDGAGYNLVAQTVLQLDPLNPQVAARLLSAFRSWRILEPERRELAGAILERVAGTEGLSPDVFEIATKSLK